MPRGAPPNAAQDVLPGTPLLLYLLPAILKSTFCVWRCQLLRRGGLSPKSKGPQRPWLALSFSGPFHPPGRVGGPQLWNRSLPLPEAPLRVFSCRCCQGFRLGWACWLRLMMSSKEGTEAAAPHSPWHPQGSSAGRGRAGCKRSITIMVNLVLWLRTKLPRISVGGCLSEARSAIVPQVFWKRGGPGHFPPLLNC